MSKIIQPFGQLAKEIYIKADVNGLVVVEARTITATYTKGFRSPTTRSVPMDAREMVLALIKIVQDYSTVIFASMGEGLIGAMKTNGEANKDNNNSGQSG